MDEALRLEINKLGKTGVKTLCVCPFFINTGMFEGAHTRWPLLVPMLEPPWVRFNFSMIFKYYFRFKIYLGIVFCFELIQNNIFLH